MDVWQYQAGRLTTGGLFVVFLLLVSVVVTITVVPAIVNTGELAVEISELADQVVHENYSNDMVLQGILDKAYELHLPITRGNVYIRRDRRRIKIEVIYKYQLEFPLVTYGWDKRHYETRPLS